MIISAAFPGALPSGEAEKKGDAWGQIEQDEFAEACKSGSVLEPFYF